MLTDHSTEGPIVITPEIDDGGPRLRCLIFHEWETPLDARFLSLAETLLSGFGSTAVEGSATLTDDRGEEKDVHGDYRKVRRKLARFLAEPGDASPTVQIWGAPRIADSGFFRFAYDIGAGVAHDGQTYGWFAAHETQVSHFRVLADRAAPMVFGALGSGYGGCFDFPARYGVAGYVATVVTVPRGVSVMANEAYADRLQRWRENIWHRGLRARQGYLREVYPVNFLLEAHLRMPFRGAPLARFMEAEGRLEPCAFNAAMYRWDVPEENLGAVRMALEPSGLVLSSAAEPLRVD